MAGLQMSFQPTKKDVLKALGPALTARGFPQTSTGPVPTTNNIPGRRGSPPDRLDLYTRKFVPRGP